MADTQHTPVPWSIGGLSSNPGEGHVIESDSADGRTIAWTCNSLDNNGEEYISQEDIANAKFIIRACNSHDALLEVLENALADLEGIMPEYEPSGDRLHPGWQTIQDIKEAIANAEGGA
jgi:YD repeat-containing protein